MGADFSRVRFNPLLDYAGVPSPVQTIVDPSVFCSPLFLHIDDGVSDLLR
jgi:hypothetical protein